MSNPPFTAGPWGYKKSGVPTDGEYDFAIYVAGKVIGEAFGRVDHGEAGKRPAEANARLMAAAPVLLNMVKWSIKHDGECLADHADLLHAALSAVNEVEGRTQPDGE